MIGAVDIGGTKIAVGVVNSNGRLLARQECPTDTDGGYSAALDRIVSMLREVQDSAHAGITGIGIGSTGPVSVNWRNRRRQLLSYVAWQKSGSGSAACFRPSRGNGKRR
jgi:predicted NBD/HSP70 family sugar kinase